MTDNHGPESDPPARTMPQSQAAPLSEQPCLNCGDPVPGNYCRMCGQRKAEHRVSVRRLLADALQDQFSLTSELPRTFKALAFKPGFLTTEYSRGRIASYIPPFRVYLVTSIIFFLLLSFEASGRNPLSTGDSNFKLEITSDSTEAGTPADSLRADIAERRKQGPNVNTPFEMLNDKLKAKSEILEKDPEFRERLKEYMIRRTPTMMFVLLPVFALLMQLFYWRTGRFYAEHFIYSLHTHAFAFLVFTGLLLLPDTGMWDIIGKCLFAWLMVYPLLAMRRVYAQGWIMTFTKYLVVGMVYVVIFGLAMYVQTVIALLLL